MTKMKFELQLVALFLSVWVMDATGTSSATVKSNPLTDGKQIPVGERLLQLQVETDCSMCDHPCSPNNAVCESQRLACETTAAEFRSYSQSIQQSCQLDDSTRRPEPKERKFLEKAKGMLVCKGFYTNKEVHFNSEPYQFCKGDLTDLSGLTPSQDKVLFVGDWQNASVEELSTRMARELVHIDQCRVWGDTGYACKYSLELMRGHGFGEATNPLEVEAIDMASAVEACYRDETRCQASCPAVSTLTKILLAFLSSIPVRHRFYSHHINFDHFRSQLDRIHFVKAQLKLKLILLIWQ